MLTPVYPGVWSLEYGWMQRQHNGYDCGPYVLNAIMQDVNGLSTAGIPNRNLIRQYLTENITLVSFCPENNPPTTTQRVQQWTAA